MDLSTALTTAKRPLNAASYASELSETIAAYNAYLTRSAEATADVEAYFAVPAAFLRVFRGAEGQLPVLYALGRHAYRLSRSACRSQEECARLLLRLLTACIAEKQDRVCKRAGAYLMASLLLRCYFHCVRQTGLIGNVVRVMGQCELPPVEQFPKGHVCMYKFYLSKYLIGKGQYAEALVSLEWIGECLLAGEVDVDDCGDGGDGAGGGNEAEASVTANASTSATASAKANKNTKTTTKAKTKTSVFKRNFKRVMRLLVPLKLLLQQQWPLLPTSRNEPLLKALWDGHVQRYSALLTAQRPALLQQGTFIIYQRLQLLCFLRLVRRLRQDLGSTRIPLQLIASCSGAEREESVVSWLVELISKGAVRGYVSEEHGYLVLSGQNPFPAGCGIGK